MTRMTIWFTSDTHGYFFDTDFIHPEPRDIGLLGFRFPKDENTLVIDGGDTTMGSPLTAEAFTSFIIYGANFLWSLAASRHRAACSLSRTRQGAQENCIMGRSALTCAMRTNNSGSNTKLGS